MVLENEDKYTAIVLIQELGYGQLKRSALGKQHNCIEGNLVTSEKSYRITLKNNRTEKEALDYLIENNPHFHIPTLEGRKSVMQMFGLDSSFTRAFDLFFCKEYTNNVSEIDLLKTSEVTLIEIKSTRKELQNLPRGFFFGATENEFKLARKLGDKYKFCFISLHPDSLGYCLLSLTELEKLIKNKRTQYQINLRTS